MIAVFFVVGLVVRLVTVLAFGLLGMIFHERRGRRTFRRTLRRSGLTESEVDELTADYHVGVGIRDLLRKAESGRRDRAVPGSRRMG